MEKLKPHEAPQFSSTLLTPSPFQGGDVSQELSDDEPAESSRGLIPRPAPTTSQEAVTEVMDPLIPASELQDVAKDLAKSVKKAFDQKTRQFSRQKENQSWDHQTLLALDDEASPSFDFALASAEEQRFAQELCHTITRRHSLLPDMTPDRLQELNISDLALSQIPPLDAQAKVRPDESLSGKDFYSRHSFFTQVCSEHYE